jgi:peptide/nickel transport system substrate-binding protein
MKKLTQIASRVVLLIVAIAVFAVSFGAANPVSVSADSHRVVKVRLKEDLITLDPAHVGKPSDHVHAFSIYSGLVRLKAGTTEMEPDLATKWTLSPDGKVYTFHLRRGVKFHKGYGNFTAKDVKYTFERIMNPKTKSRYRGLFRTLKKIEIINDYTIKLTLDKPYPSFLRAVLGFRPGWIVSKKAIEEKGKRYGQDPIGTGPFMFDRWVRGSEVSIKRNPDYWDKIHIDRVVGKVIRKDNVAKLALERGDIDVAYFFSGATIREILKNKKLKIQMNPGYATHFLQFNLKKKPFNDIRVRRAILYATDKAAIAKYVFFGLATPRQSLLNPNVFGYEKLEKNFYDPAKAKRLLAEAGYAKGLKVDVNVIPSSGWPQMAAVLQEQWRKVGIQAKMNVPERAIWNRRWRKSQFDILFTRITRFDPDQYLYQYFFSKTRPHPNTSGYAGADSVILNSRHTVDRGKREGFIKAAAKKIFVEDLAGFAIVNVNYVLVTQPYIKGHKVTFQDSHPWRQVRIEK